MNAESPKKHPSQVIRIRARQSGAFRVLDSDSLLVETARAAVTFRDYVKELWQRRSLVRVLAGRQLKSNYEMNIVGFGWWLLEPLSLTIVYVVLMDFILHRADPKPYPLFVLTALLPFKWFVSSLLGAMGTVRANSSLVTDVYFPRALLPITEIATGLAHFGVAMIVVPFVMFFYGIAPTWHLIFLPVAVFAEFILILGLAYPMSVWGLNYRNLPGLTNNLIRLWFYLSPALWSIEGRVKGDLLQNIVRLNPLTGVFTTYHNAVFFHKPPGWEVLWTLFVGLTMCFFGGWYFTRREPNFGKML